MQSLLQLVPGFGFVKCSSAATRLDVQGQLRQVERYGYCRQHIDTGIRQTVV